jgi:GTP pyrophosphokinase
LVGIDPGVAFRYAGCCRPVPGDAVVGLVRTGRPISVHRAECRVLARSTQGEGRALDLAWNYQGGVGGGGAARVSARLAVSTVNRPGSLGSVTTVIGKQGGNIVDVRVGRRTADLYEMLLDVEVESVDHLLRVQAALRATPCVTAVERNRA